MALSHEVNKTRTLMDDTLLQKDQGHAVFIKDIGIAD